MNYMYLVYLKAANVKNHLCTIDKTAIFSMNYLNFNIWTCVSKFFRGESYGYTL